MHKRKRIDDTISFDNLPYEVLIRIFNNFELSDLGKMAITSKANREVVKDIQKSILGIFRPFLWFSEKHLFYNEPVNKQFEVCFMNVGTIQKKDIPYVANGVSTLATYNRNYPPQMLGVFLRIKSSPNKLRENKKADYNKLINELYYKYPLMLSAIGMNVLVHILTQKVTYIEPDNVMKILDIMVDRNSFSNSAEDYCICYIFFWMIKIYNEKKIIDFFISKLPKILEYSNLDIHSDRVYFEEILRLQMFHDNADEYYKELFKVSARMMIDKNKMNGYRLFKISYSYNKNVDLFEFLNHNREGLFIVKFFTGFSMNHKLQFLIYLGESTHIQYQKRLINFITYQIITYRLFSIIYSLFMVNMKKDVPSIKLNRLMENDLFIKLVFEQIFWHTFRVNYALQSVIHKGSYDENRTRMTAFMEKIDKNKQMSSMGIKYDMFDICLNLFINKKIIVKSEHQKKIKIMRNTLRHIMTWKPELYRKMYDEYIKGELQFILVHY